MNTATKEATEVAPSSDYREELESHVARLRDDVTLLRGCLYPFMTISEDESGLQPYTDELGRMSLLGKDVAREAIETARDVVGDCKGAFDVADAVGNGADTLFRRTHHAAQVMVAALEYLQVGHTPDSGEDAYHIFLLSEQLVRDVERFENDLEAAP